MKYKLEKEGGFFIKEIEETEKEQLGVLVLAFKITDNQAPQMCNKILSNISKRILEFETLRQFSKWCHTNVRYVKPQEKAREISYFLFDDLIPRLCDQENKTQEHHVESYKKFLSKLSKNGFLLETKQYKKFRVTFYDRGILLNREFEFEE